MKFSSLRLMVCTLGLIGLAGCTLSARSQPTISPDSAATALFSLSEGSKGKPLVFIAYGDMRFTDPAEHSASWVEPRRALVARVAAERPTAVFLNGDVPWHGGVVNDYRVYEQETQAWREAKIRVFPALGNHEFSQCAEAECLQNWWHAFPELTGHRWYSVALGSQVLALMVDSDASFLPGSEQRQWVEQTLQHLDAGVRFVLISLHHPPAADPQGGSLASHNARPNEEALASYLGQIAPGLSAKIVVSAGHVHNYERNEQDGIVYLVSGGGGASPYPVDRSPKDLYQGKEFPNFHYLRFELVGSVLKAQMIRLRDPQADAAQAQWDVKDQFEVVAKLAHAKR